jgi:hypothetical protein
MLANEQGSQVAWKNTMGRNFEAVEKFFIEDEWNYVQLGDSFVLKLGFSGDNGEWQCYAQVNEDLEQFVFYSVCSSKVPFSKRGAIAEFISRVNFGLIIGNFELDMTDGEIRYKTSIDVEDDRLTYALIKRLVYPNVLMMDKYYPGIMAVLYGNISPKEAVELVELGS